MDKKEQIIKTAIKLFVKQGFENTPTSQISRESKVATGTLFHHFKTKEDLINEAYKYVKKSMLDAVTKDFDDEEELKKSTKRVWFNLVKWGIKNRDMHDFLQKFYNSSYISNVTVEETRKGFERIGQNFVRGINEKKFKQLSIELLGDVTWGLYNVFVNAHSKIDNKKLEQSFQVLWDALSK